MKLIHLDGKTYKFDPDDILLSELFVIQAQTGLRLRAWQEALADTDPSAVKSLLFMLKARAGENPEWDEIDFNIKDLDVEDEEVVPDPPVAEEKCPDCGTATSACSCTPTEDSLQSASTA